MSMLFALCALTAAHSNQVQANTCIISLLKCDRADCTWPDDCPPDINCPCVGPNQCTGGLSSGTFSSSDLPEFTTVASEYGVLASSKLRRRLVDMTLAHVSN